MSPEIRRENLVPLALSAVGLFIFAFGAWGKIKPKDRRQGSEFDERTKNHEIRNWHKKNPNQKDAEIEVHHILPIAEGKKRGVSSHQLRSQSNAVAVEQTFHKEVHRKNSSEEYDQMAELLKNEQGSFLGD